MDVEAKRRRLAEMFARFRVIPFPGCREEDHEFTKDLSEFWMELVDYDGYIAGIISTISQNSPVRHELYFDHALQDQLDSIIEVGSEAAVAEAQCLSDYLGLLKEMIDLGLEILAVS